MTEENKTSKLDFEALEPAADLICQLVYTDREKAGFSPATFSGNVLSVERTQHGITLNLMENDSYKGTLTQLNFLTDALESQVMAQGYFIFNGVSVVRGLDWVNPSVYENMKVEISVFHNPRRGNPTIINGHPPPINW